MKIRSESVAILALCVSFQTSAAQAYVSDSEGEISQKEQSAMLEPHDCIPGDDLGICYQVVSYAVVLGGVLGAAVFGWGLFHVLEVRWHLR